MGRDSVELTSGDAFRVEVDGAAALQPTCMESRHFAGGGEYYAIDGAPLRDGLRTAPGSRR